MKTKARDPLIICKRGTEMSHADDRNVPMLVEPQNIADALLEFRDVVTHALFSELPKKRKVFPNLFGVDGKAATKFLRGGNLHALIRQLTQTAIVARQAVNGGLGYG